MVKTIKKIKGKIPQILTEYQEQCLVAEYLNRLIPSGKVVKYTAIPNGTWTPSFAQKTKNKKMGLNPGIPDLFIIGRTKIICIEMKRTQGSTTSKEQWEWIETLNKYNIPSFVCFGYEGAKEVIDRELL